MKLCPLRKKNTFEGIIIDYYECSQNNFHERYYSRELYLSKYYYCRKGAEHSTFSQNGDNKSIIHDDQNSIYRPESTSNILKAS